MKEAYAIPKVNLNTNAQYNDGKFVLKPDQGIFNRNRITCMCLQIIAALFLFINGNWLFSIIFAVFASDQFKKIQDFKSGRLRLSHLSLDEEKIASSHLSVKDHRV